jgi:hypothetical protein
MKLTIKNLRELHACSEGVAWFEKSGCETTEGAIAKILKSKHAKKYQWANWLLSRVFTQDNATRYAIFAARQVLEIFEKTYLEDKRPRSAIEAAERCLKTHSEEDKLAAESAASAVSSASSAESSAELAASSALEASAAAWYKTCLKIIHYGLKLLKEQQI